MKTEALLDTFGKMTLLELSEFVKAFEERFDVRAAAPVQVQPGELNILAVEPEAEEDLEWTVAITAVGDKKIQVIKEVRTITKLGLSDAKALVDNLPNSVVENVDKLRADEVRTALEKAGATVTVVPS